MEPHVRAGHARLIRHYLIGLALAVSATWLELLILRSPISALSLTPFGLAVALTVWVGGTGPGLMALVVCAIALDYLIVGPGQLFEFQAPADALVVSGFVMGWLGFCAVAARRHRLTETDRARAHAAEAASRQSQRIAQLTAALSHARTHAAAIEAALQEPLHGLSADAGLLLLIGRDGRATDVARAVGYTDGERELRTRMVLREKTPASDAVGRGAPVLLESSAAFAAEYGVPAGARRPGPFEAIVAVPLLAGSRVIAVVQLEFRLPRVFSDEDRAYLDVLAPRAAQALDRTLEYESALRARDEAEALRARANQELAQRQHMESALRASETRYRTLAARTSRLHELAAALSGAVTLQAVARAVIEHGRKVLGAANGEVLLLVDGAFETLYSDVPAGAASAGRFPMEPGLCATAAVELREPIYIGSFEEWQERYPRSAAVAADGGYVSSATLSLLADGAPIGVLAFHFTAPVNFDDEYRALLRSVEQHCTQALDRARLYETAQQARADAETANRLKDEFVSIVSHELRTPLNAILGWTSMLQERTLDEPTSERALQAISDNATRQARLVDDLLDFSRMQSGRMTLDIQDVDLRSLLRGVVESIVPTAVANGQHLDLEPVPAVPLRGDPRRLEQIFFNLLGNAMKFTPSGGRIAMSVRPLTSTVEVRVSDTGEGIDPAFLPHMFDAFRQADRATGRRHGGVGLGLSIARELAEAHKGSIAAESAGEGHGATFIVRLPMAGTAAAAATVH